MKVKLVSLEDGITSCGFRKIASYVSRLNPATETCYVTTRRYRSFLGSIKGTMGGKGAKLGSDCALGPTFSILTRRSNHAACPVTGSELEYRKPSPFSGNNSLIRWFSKNPSTASVAPSSNPHAPLRLPIAFHVQTVFSFSAAIWATGAVMAPEGEITRA